MNQFKLFQIDFVVFFIAPRPTTANPVSFIIDTPEGEPRIAPPVAPPLCDMAFAAGSPRFDTDQPYVILEVSYFRILKTQDTYALIPLDPLAGDYSLDLYTLLSSTVNMDWICIV